MEETKKPKHRRKHRFLTGEDIDMFHERERKEKTRHDESICDTNIDGA